MFTFTALTIAQLLGLLLTLLTLTVFVHIEERPYSWGSVLGISSITFLFIMQIVAFVLVHFT